MRQIIIGWLRKTPFYHPLRNRFQRQRHADEIKLWQQRGCSVPVPHIIKQHVLKEYARKYGLRTLIETGTYLGDMVEAVKDSFDKVISIELSVGLCERAKKRFAGDRHVEIIQGDSGSELGKLMGRTHQPVLFWLDGHYSGGPTARGEKDCPIVEELDSIAVERILRHVIIIDDAHLFGLDPQYPSIDQLKKHVSSKWRNVEVAIQHDSIRITPT